MRVCKLGRGRERERRGRRGCKRDRGRCEDMLKMWIVIVTMTVFLLPFLHDNDDDYLLTRYSRRFVTVMIMLLKYASI